MGIFSFFSCVKKTPAVKPSPSEVKNVEWAKNAVIYEVNIRQFTQEGTFKAFSNHLLRLKKMGVDIIWIMPVHPIGEKFRKGKLGSYYAVKDYKAINPEFGNMDDFKALVDEAHTVGLKVIIDWVPNHSSWDNNLVTEHPEFYLKDSTGKLVSPFDWTDVVRFDYNKPEMKHWMIETMKYWLNETNIDGFRCDVAHMVPVEFWDSCRVELDKVKPIFFLAESEQPFLHAKAFDMTYDWKFHHIMNDIAKGKKNARQIAKHFAWVDSAYHPGSILMQFTSNHDENSWAGTEYERMKDGAKAFAVIAATVPGMMLMYNGQESAFNRRLKFFDKDSINWGSYSLEPFYKALIDLKHHNQALWNGFAGGDFSILKSNQDTSVIAFVRQKEDDKVVVICNVKPQKVDVKFDDEHLEGTYKDIFTSNKTEFTAKSKISLLPWEYKVLERVNE